MVLFGTSGIRGGVQGKLRPETVVSVARAVATDSESVVIGRDSRTSSDALYYAAAAGAAIGGARVDAIGLVPTSALAFASRGRIGIMVTASHNPPTDNGLKMFEDGWEFDRASERQVEARIATENPPESWERWGTLQHVPGIDDYLRAVTAYLEETVPSIGGLHVAVDCGSGTAIRATPAVLRNIGGKVTTVNGTPDGHFPARSSEPSTESLTTFRHYVNTSETELGLAHDGDADRIVVIDSDGQVVHEDTVTAVLGQFYVERSDLDDPIVVATPNASSRIDALVEQAGGTVNRAPLGRLNEGIHDAGGSAVLAAEPWKHVHPAFGPWIDGIVSAGVVVGLVAQCGDVASLVANVDEIPYLKASLDCPSGSKAAVMDTVERRISETFPDATIETRMGIRVNMADGDWLLVRPSGTEAKIRLYVESAYAEQRLEKLKALVTAAIAAEATG